VPPDSDQQPPRDVAWWCLFAVLSLASCDAPGSPCERYLAGDSCSVGSVCIPASSPVNPSTPGLCARRCQSDHDCPSGQRCTEQVNFADGSVCWH
jgi:hypothetical protein